MFATAMHGVVCRRRFLNGIRTYCLTLGTTRYTKFSYWHKSVEAKSTARKGAGLSSPKANFSCRVFALKLRVCLTAGDVVLRSRQHYLVTSVRSGILMLVRISSPDGPRHRAHVFAQDWPELALSGLDCFNVMFGCERITREVPTRVRRIGCVSASLLGRVRAALAREDQDRRFEDAAGLGSNLMAVTASAGRRVAHARHA